MQPPPRKVSLFELMLALIFWKTMPGGRVLIVNGSPSVVRVSRENISCNNNPPLYSLLKSIRWAVWTFHKGFLGYSDAVWTVVSL